MAWESVPGNSAGAMNGDGSRKLLLHDTEGSTIEGAIGAYRKNNSWPTLTVDCRRRRVVRHLPDNVAARSLRNDAGGADQTNRDGSVHIQIEIVGFANNRDGSMFSSREDYVWFGREVVGPLCRRNAIPIQSSVRWVAYPDSYGTGASQRLSPAAWDAYSGVLAHMHCPDNTHGDTGLIDIATILSAARGDDDMPLNETDRDIIAKGVEDAVTARTASGRPGRARDDYKTLIIGSVGHGLHDPGAGTAEPGEGDLIEPFKRIVREVLQEAGLVPSVPPAG